MLTRLDRNKTEDLCSVEDCKLMDYQKFELYFIGRRMESARNVDALEKTWKEISKKKLTPDELTRNIYKRRKQEIIDEQSKK